MAITCPTGSICSDPYTTNVGKNQTNLYFFTSTKVSQDSSGKVNGGTTTLYYSPSPNNYVPAATTSDNGKTWDYLKDSSGNTILGADAQKSLQTGALKTNTNAAIGYASKDAGIPDNQSKNLKLNQNTATPDGGATDPTVAPAKEIKASTAISGTNQGIGGLLKYPLEISDSQNKIKFEVVKYRPRATDFASPTNLSGFAARESRVDILSTIFLPIPGGISDTNSVNWGQDEMNAATAQAAKVALDSIGGGLDKGIGKGLTEMGTALTDLKVNSEVRGGLANFFAAMAIGSDAGKLLSRTTGQVLNPNMELLFNGPELRSFTFTFKMSARNKPEADMIVKIIRTFKQSMAAQKSETQLYLKAPNTFKITYLHKGSDAKGHTRIGQIKECALQSMTTRYAPEGQYAIYYDGTPVSYEIDLTFKELEPIFNDDYAELSGIGY